MQWLNQLDRPVYLTYWHEPMGDIGPALYRERAAAMARMIQQHPNGGLVLRNGPCLTRYWISQPGTDVEDWWYDGANAFFADSYGGGERYMRPDEMFGKIASTAQAFEVPWGVPEFGSTIPTGTTDADRANWAFMCADWINDQPDCLGIGWFCVDAWHLEGTPNTQRTWAEVLRLAAVQ